MPKNAATATKTLASTGFSIADLSIVADRAHKATVKLHEIMLMPDSVKNPPTFSIGQLAKLCGMERHQITYRLKNKGLPQGVPHESNSIGRIFTLAELQTWISEVKPSPVRDASQGEQACVIAVSNFKGGVGKTSTAMALAQGLTLRGLKVLAIDSDPQGSLTTLYGLAGRSYVDYGQTLGPLCDGDIPDVSSLIQPTYWNNIDLIPASISLYEAEFSLPARQVREIKFEFWNVLNSGLEPLKSKYDVIIIDTSPSLSYLTLNALMAANVCLVPIPPESLDFASLGQFWTLFSDLAGRIEKFGSGVKRFDAVHLLLSKVEESNPSTAMVRSWLQQTYGSMLLPAEIPKSVVVSSASTEFGTVYDISKYSGALKTYARIRDSYDQMIDELMPSIQSTWRNSAK